MDRHKLSPFLFEGKLPIEQPFINHVPTQSILQAPFDAAVVIPTVLRPSLARPVRSVYGQRFPGRIQVLIGVDRPRNGSPADPGVLDVLRRECPAHCVLSVLDLGYSTSVRNGGLYRGGCGGAVTALPGR